MQLLKSFINDDSVKNDQACKTKCTNYRDPTLFRGCDASGKILTASSPEDALNCQFYAFEPSNYYNNSPDQCYLYRTDGNVNGKTYPFNTSTQTYGNPIPGILTDDGSMGTESCGRPKQPTTQTDADSCKNYCQTKAQNCPLSVATFDANKNECTCLRFNYISGTTNFNQ